MRTAVFAAILRHLERQGYILYRRQLDSLNGPSERVFGGGVRCPAEYPARSAGRPGTGEIEISPVPVSFRRVPF